MTECDTFLPQDLSNYAVAMCLRVQNEWVDPLPSSCTQTVGATRCTHESLAIYLLAAVRGQIEYKHGEETDAHAGDDEVDGVEERLSSHGDVERDVEVGLLAARVVLDVANGGHLQDVPLHRHVVLRQVHADLHLRPSQLLVNVPQIDLHLREDTLEGKKKISFAIV